MPARKKPADLGDPESKFNTDLPLWAQLADHLAREIISGRLAQGTWIREQDVADRYHVGRGAVREALHRLCEERLVEMVPWRGARVVVLTADDIDGLFLVVRALTGTVACLAAERFGPAEQARLSALVAEMAADFAADKGMERQLSSAFLAASYMARNCGHDIARDLLVQLGRLAFWQYSYLLGAPKAWRKRAILIWQRVGEGVMRRDADAAEEAARQMVQDCREFVMAKVRAGVVPPVSRLRQTGPASL